MCTVKKTKIYNFMDQPFLTLHNLFKRYIQLPTKHLQITKVYKKNKQLEIGDKFNAILQGDLEERKFQIYKITSKNYILVSPIRTVYTDFNTYYAIESYYVHKINKKAIDSQLAKWYK